MVMLRDSVPLTLNVSCWFLIIFIESFFSQLLPVLCRSYQSCVHRVVDVDLMMTECRCTAE